MKCIFLCAGYATRLFPLTENFPKALIKVAEKPILDYILDEVNKIKEIDQIYLVTNAKYTPHFETWANEKNNIKPIKVLNDGTYTKDDRLGGIGDINFVIENEKIDDDTMVIAGDNLFEFSLEKYVDFYNEKKAPCVCVRKEEDIELLKRVGVAKIDENLKIVDFTEKPPVPQSDLAVYATYIYPKSVLKLFKMYLDEGNSCDAPGNFITYLHKKEDTYTFIFEEQCYDVGTHESLKMVNDIYNNRR